MSAPTIELKDPFEAEWCGLKHRRCRTHDGRTGAEGFLTRSRAFGIDGVFTILALNKPSGLGVVNESNNVTGHD